MSLVSSTAKITSNTGFYDFPIEQSLRFDGVSSYLSRTPTTTGDRKVFTLSLWIKRGNLAAYGSAYEIFFSVGTGTYDFRYQFTSNDTLVIYSPNSSATAFGGIDNTNRVFRDTSAWYHIVISLDKNSGNIFCYVNGESDLSLSPSYNNWTGDSNVNVQNIVHNIGRQTSGYYYFNGYLANIQFIDGQALDPYFFGESKNGVWIPYNAFSTAGSGTATASDGDTATDSYGTNGFHLTFEDGIETLSVNSSNVSAFRDKSHNTNHWKIN
jgi:hypothetical protein